MAGNETSNSSEQLLSRQLLIMSELSEKMTIRLLEIENRILKMKESNYLLNKKNTSSSQKMLQISQSRLTGLRDLLKSKLGKEYYEDLEPCNVYNSNKNSDPSQSVSLTTNYQEELEDNLSEQSLSNNQTSYSADNTCDIKHVDNPQLEFISSFD